MKLTRKHLRGLILKEVRNIKTIMEVEYASDNVQNVESKISELASVLLMGMSTVTGRDLIPEEQEEFTRQIQIALEEAQPVIVDSLHSVFMDFRHAGGDIGPDDNDDYDDDDIETQRARDMGLIPYSDGTYAYEDDDE